MKPRDIHIATAAGGGLIGLVSSGVGLLDFVAAFNGGANSGLFALEGAVLVSAGAAFILVSVIVLPALRAMRMEPPRTG